MPCSTSTPTTQCRSGSCGCDDALIDKVLWFFANFQVIRLAGLQLGAIVIGLCIYQSQYPYVLVRSLWRRAFGDGFVPFKPGEAPGIGMTIPTLLRNRDDLEGLFTGIGSAITSNYPGRLTVMAVIDGLDAAPDLVQELRDWVAARALPSNVYVEVVGTPTRVGKACAGDHGVRRIVELAEQGVIPGKPRVYFNMDADCELSPYALERMVRALYEPSRINGQPGMVVTSHVAIREQEYWKGWRHFFTWRGQIAVNVAREYMVAIGVGRHNVLRILPQNGASGALYCTWFEVLEAAPHWARFLRDLRLVDWLRWWTGAPPPRFEPSEIEPLPEGLSGMGEDTWLSWLALTGRMVDGKVTLALPRTPAHALWYAFVTFFARPFRYDPHAKIYTTTPTSLKALFLQRVRWNISRIWTVQNWGLGLLYHLVIGIPAIFDVALSTTFQAMIVGGVLLAPFSGRAVAMAPAIFLMIELGYFLERVFATFLGMIQDSDEKGGWKRILGLPWAGTFHFVFNVASTIVGFVRQVFGNGYNDRFAPESSLIKGRTARVAFGYRIRRFYALCWRSLVHGDVPLGWFWFGWHETKWTHNGYAGWSTGKVPPIVKPVPAALPAPATPATVGPTPAAAPVVAYAGPVPDGPASDDLPDSGIRRRVALASVGTASEPGLPRASTPSR